MAVFLPLADAIGAGLQAVGGKAFNLALLDRYGLPVPRSCVLTADDLDTLLARENIREAQADAVGRLPSDASAASFAIGALTERIRAAAPSDADRASLRAALRASGLIDRPLAVRSSAGAEDGFAYSFAGVHESVLNVQGEDAIWRAIRHCQASFWSDRALQYRRRAGIADEAFRGAVLLCAMVGPSGLPDASGVLFTADPILGDGDRFVVEAVAGLGEDLVSGRVTPARGSYDLRTTHWRAEADMSVLLSPARVQALVRAALRIRDALSNGDDLVQYDIEWARTGDALMILQARPVTAAPKPVPGLSTIWSRANLIEVLPDTLSAMAWSLTRPGIRWTLLEPYGAFERGTAGRFPLLKRIAGRPFLELSAIQFLSFKTFGVPPADINESLGGRQPQIPTDMFAGGGAERARRLVRAARYGIGLLRLGKRLRPAFAESQALDRELAAEDLNRVPLDRLADWLRRIADFSQRAQLGLAAGAPVPWLTILRAATGRSLGEQAALGLVGGLLAGRGDIVSAEHGHALAQLGRLTDAIERSARLDDFIARFGHRGFGELDIANPRWREDRHALDALALSLAGAPDARSRTTERRADAEAVLRRLTFAQRVVVKLVIPRAADAFALREAARSESVRLLGALRRIALEAGQRLHRSGQIGDPDDVFLLTFADLACYLEGEWSGREARALVESRRAQAEGWRASPPPPATVVEESPGVVTARPAQAVPGDTKSWSGLAVSPGCATGIARVLSSPDEADRFGPGDIVITTTTDPAWTPLFLKAGGLVVEYGGYLSHGAIVAREFAIPAVVDVPGATSEISDGARIRIDGTLGRIWLLDAKTDAEACPTSSTPGAPSASIGSSV